MSDTIPRDEGKQWGAIHELRGAIKELRAWVEGVIDKLMVILTGVNGDNGLRGDIKTLNSRVAATEHEISRVEKWGQELWHEKREPTCIGKKLLHDYEQRHIADHDRELEEREASTQMITSAIAQLTMRLDNMRDRDELIQREREKDRATTRVAIIGMFGSIIVAAITVAGPIIAQILDK